MAAARGYRQAFRRQGRVFCGALAVALLIVAGAELLELIEPVSAIHPTRPEILRLVASIVVLVGAVAQVRRDLDSSSLARRRRVAALRANIGWTVTAERARVARALHSGVDENLAAAHVSYADIERRVSDPGIRPILRRIDRALEDAMHDINAVAQTSSDEPQRVSLLALVEAGTELARERFKLPVTVLATPGNFEIDTAVAHEIGLILTEALSNVSRHADATRADVVLKKDADILTIAITDDGAGFDPSTERRGHFGLVGMRERANAIGASLAIESAPGAGSRVLLAIPVAPPPLSVERIR
jgi:signal transduction histidine kinase